MTETRVCRANLSLISYSPANNLHTQPICLLILRNYLPLINRFDTQLRTCLSFSRMQQVRHDNRASRSFVAASPSRSTALVPYTGPRHHQSTTDLSRHFMPAPAPAPAPVPSAPQPQPQPPTPAPTITWIPVTTTPYPATQQPIDSTPAEAARHTPRHHHFPQPPVQQYYPEQVLVQAPVHYSPVPRTSRARSTSRPRHDGYERRERSSSTSRNRRSDGNRSCLPMPHPCICAFY